MCPELSPLPPRHHSLGLTLLLWFLTTSQGLISPFTGQRFLYRNLRATNGWCCVRLKVVTESGRQGRRRGSDGPPVIALMAGDLLVLLCQDVRVGAFAGGMHA